MTAQTLTPPKINGVNQDNLIPLFYMASGEHMTQP